MAASLPPEIIRLILQQLGHVSTILEDYYGHGHSQYEKPAAQAEKYAKTRTLLSACLVNRAWSREAQVLLYSNVNCIQQDMLYGSAAMHSQEFARVRMDSNGSDGELYDESLDEDSDDSTDGESDEFEVSSQEGSLNQDQHDGAEIGPHVESHEEDETESESDESLEGESVHSEDDSEILDHNTVFASSNRRNPGLAGTLSKDSCSADISVRIEALLRTLCSSPQLASYVKTLSLSPQSDESTFILSYCAQVEEVCFLSGGKREVNNKLDDTLYKLQKLRQCQLHRFSAVQTYLLLHFLAISRPLEAIRLSRFRWDASDTFIGSRIRSTYLLNVRSVLIDSAALPADHFRVLLSRLDRVSDPKRLDIRLHGIAWVEEGDTYNPFGKLSKTTAESITAYKIRDSAFEVSDFRGLERLTSLHTLGIFGSHCAPGASGFFHLSDSITTLELGGNECEAVDDDHTPVIISLVDAWIREGKLPNLKTFVARPGDFALLNLESIYYNKTHEEIAREIASLKRKVESLQEALDAQKVNCTIRPVADLQRFLDHIRPVFWNEGQPWTGILEDRLEDLMLSGVQYTFWKG